MKNKMQKLVEQLDRKRMPEAIEFEFLKLGKHAFDYLYDAVKNQKLSKRQTQNTFHILFQLTREHCYGEQNRLLQLALARAMDEQPEIRGDAAIIAIRLTELGEQFPILAIADRTMVATIMENAYALGLPEPSREDVNDFVMKSKRQPQANLPNGFDIWRESPPTLVTQKH